MRKLLLHNLFCCTFYHCHPDIYLHLFQPTKIFQTVYSYTYTSNSWDNGQDFYVVRYAEVLLSLAEAMVQKGGYAYSDVTALVNEVRQRADVNMPTVEEVEGTSLSKDELLEVIKHPRICRSSCLVQ